MVPLTWSARRSVSLVVLTCVGLASSRASAVEPLPLPTIPVGDDGVYPAPPPGPVMLAAPPQEVSRGRLLVGGLALAGAVGLAVTGALVFSWNEDRRLDLTVAEANATGTLPTSLAATRDQRRTERDELQSSIDVTQSVSTGLLFGAGVFAVVGLAILLVRPSPHTELKLAGRTAAVERRF